MRPPRLLSLVAFTGLLVFAPRTGHTERAVTIRLKDHLAHRWTDELLTYRLTFEAGAFRPGRLSLHDEKGTSIPIQVTEPKLNKDGSLANASVSFVLSELPANGERTFHLTGESKTPAYKTDLSVKEKGGVLEVTTSKMGVRLLAGQKSFEAPLPAKDIPAPVQGVRLRSGKWIGRGWWETEAPCLGYQSEVLASGPVFADVRVRFLFAGDKHYTATYRVIAGQEVVLVEEEFNLGDPKRFVLPDYDEKYGLQWDWWGGSQGRSASSNNLYFSIYDGKLFTPDTARWCGWNSTIPGKMTTRWGAPYPASGFDYPLNYGKRRLEIVINAKSCGDAESDFLATWDQKSRNDALIIMGARASKWVHPHLLNEPPRFIKQWVMTNNIGIWVTEEPDLRLRSPVNMGRRFYLIAALDAKADVAEKPGAPDHLRELFVKHHHAPLDKIKDWILDWEEKTPYPRLFVEPGDLAALKKRMESQPEFKQRQGGGVFRYVATGKYEDAQAAFDASMNTFRSVMRAATLEDYGSGGHQGWGWSMHAAGACMDVVLSSPAITPEQRSEARALMAYAQYGAFDPDYFPRRENGYAWGSANQGSITLTARSLYGKLLADHPLAAEWRRKGVQFATWDIERFVNEAGSTMDCVAYASAAMCPNQYVLLANQDQVDISPILPRLRAFANWRITTMTPPDVRFGTRVMVTLGDSPYGSDGTVGLTGMVLQKPDPDLAAGCLWAYRESGGGNVGFIDQLFIMDNALPASKPDLSSKCFPGSCAILRAGTGRDDETYLCYYHGSFNWGHHHSDQGQLVFYAKGAPLMMDFGSQYNPRIDQACFHNTISFNHRETEKLRPCPGRGHKDCFYTKRGCWFEHEEEPHTFFQYAMDEVAENVTASLGDVKEFAGLPEADYARGEQRISRLVEVPYRYDKLPCDCAGGEHEFMEVTPFVWSRQVVLVKDKDPLGPNYFVVHDDLAGNEKLEPAFNLWSLTKEPQIQGSRAFLPGQWGVDMDVFIAEPVAPRTVVRELAHTACGLSGQFQALHKRPFEERQKLLRVFGQPGGSGFCLLAYPRKANEPKPEFAALPNIPGVKVTLPDQTHWVIASRKEVTLQEKSFTFTGTVAVIKQFGDGRGSVALLSGGRFESGNNILQSPGPACLTVDD